jgi:hypothetical protein
MRCRLRHGAADARAGDQALPADQTVWAGFPINLDLAFSRERRDKVYVQHMMRKREAQLWQWLQDGAPLCTCDVETEDGSVPDVAESMSSR